MAPVYRIDRSFVMLGSKKSELGVLMRTWMLWLVLLLGLLAMGLGLYHYPPKSSSDAAAWAQAFGATIGIAVAIFIPWRQRQDQLRSEHIERLSARAARLARIGLLFLEVEKFANEIDLVFTPIQNGHKATHFDATPGDELVRRLIAFQDQNPDVLEQDLCYTTRDSLSALIRLTKMRAGSIMDPGAPEADPLGVRKEARKTIATTPALIALEREVKAELAKLQPRKHGAIEEALRGGA